MRSKKQIQKAHALNKKVRKEKARLHKRNKKRVRRYAKLVTYKLELLPETIAKITAESKRLHISKQAVVRRVLRKFMDIYESEGLSGIQKELNIKVDENSEQ